LLIPRSVTEAGEVITGGLRLSARRSAGLRLIPMGIGYRYAGAGFWLDGIRDQAVLYRGNRRPLACVVAALSLSDRISGAGSPEWASESRPDFRLNGGSAAMGSRHVRLPAG